MNWAYYVGGKCYACRVKTVKLYTIDAALYAGTYKHWDKEK